MALVAVLDSCVLYPLPLRDTLLRIAEAGLLAPVWSEQILSEVTDNLIADGRTTPMQARRLTDVMDWAFDRPGPPASEIIRLLESMTNHPKDRHVLAAAVAAQAQAVVTLDLGHFPVVACHRHGVTPVHPDHLLTGFLHNAPALVQVALERQSAALSRPPLSVPDLLDRLTPTVPEFAAHARAILTFRATSDAADARRQGDPPSRPDASQPAQGRTGG